MKVKTNLWRLYNQSTGYGCRPSDFFELETDLAKWALDEACLVTGRKFENMLQKGKNPFEDAALSAKQGFASAPKRRIKKVKNGNPIR